MRLGGFSMPEGDEGGRGWDRVDKGALVLQGIIIPPCREKMAEISRGVQE